MLTVDFDRFPVGPGQAVLDLGCGGGRHSFEAYRRGADVVALDTDAETLDDVHAFFEAMAREGEAPEFAKARTLHGDALDLPFGEDAFDRVIAAEVLEHIPDDTRAMAELTRVVRPGGLVAVTVPRWFPERICWALSRAYHEVEGGHVRIYSRRTLLDRLRAAGLEPLGSHHAHALHVPYWWLKCLLGVDREGGLPRAYQRFLEWDLMRQPRSTRLADQALNPLMGKSLVVYARKPVPGDGRVAA